MRTKQAAGCIALVGLLISTCACSTPLASARQGQPAALSSVPRETDGTAAAPIADPPLVPCDVPHSDADITALPGLVELVVKTGVTGPSVALDLGTGVGSELATDNATPLIGTLPHGIRIYSNVAPDAPSLPVGEYVMLLGTYDEAAGTYFTIGGDQGVYAVQPDGSLRQRCASPSGQADQEESADQVSITDLLGYVTASMQSTAPQRAEVAQHRASPFTS